MLSPFFSMLVFSPLLFLLQFFSSQLRGVPLNLDKRMINILRSTIIGGAFVGDLGWLALGGDKSHRLNLKSLLLMSYQEWSEGML